MMHPLPRSVSGQLTRFNETTLQLAKQNSRHEVASLLGQQGARTFTATYEANISLVEKIKKIFGF